MMKNSQWEGTAFIKHKCCILQAPIQYSESSYLSSVVHKELPNLEDFSFANTML